MSTFKLLFLPVLTLLAFLVCLVTCLVMIFAGGANPLYLACVGVVGGIMCYRFVRKDLPNVWVPVIGSLFDSLSE